MLSWYHIDITLNRHNNNSWHFEILFTINYGRIEIKRVKCWNGSNNVFYLPFQHQKFNVTTWIPKQSQRKKENRARMKTEQIIRCILIIISLIVKCFKHHLFQANKTIFIFIFPTKCFTRAHYYWDSVNSYSKPQHLPSKITWKE